MERGSPESLFSFRKSLTHALEPPIIVWSDEVSEFLLCAKMRSLQSLCKLRFPGIDAAGGNRRQLRKAGLHTPWRGHLRGQNHVSMAEK